MNQTDRLLGCPICRLQRFRPGLRRHRGSSVRRFYNYRSVRRHAAGGAEHIFPALRCDRVRHRPDNSSSIIFTVFHCRLTTTPSPCKRIFFQCAHSFPACAYFYRRVLADGTSRREYPNRLVALYLLAYWFCHSLAGVRLAHHRQSCAATFIGTGAVCNSLERGERNCFDVQPYMACHRRSASPAASRAGRQQHQPFGGLSDLARNIDLSHGTRSIGLPPAIRA